MKYLIIFCVVIVCYGLHWLFAVPEIPESYSKLVDGMKAKEAYGILGWPNYQHASYKEIDRWGYNPLLYKKDIELTIKFTHTINDDNPIMESHRIEIIDSWSHWWNRLLGRFR